MKSFLKPPSAFKTTRKALITCKNRMGIHSVDFCKIEFSWFVMIFSSHVPGLKQIQPESGLPYYLQKSSKSTEWIPMRFLQVIRAFRVVLNALGGLIKLFTKKNIFTFFGDFFWFSEKENQQNIRDFGDFQVIAHVWSHKSWKTKKNPQKVDFFEKY